MTFPKKILAICGSTRKNSTNQNLINAIAQLSVNRLSIENYDGLMSLPHFNPDDDNENVPQIVIDFREKVKGADGVIICTPEYAMGLPGTLKNALDWTVSSSTFSKKPVMAITASSLGEKAHQSLLDTLRIIECITPDELQLLIQHARTKINTDGIIQHEETLVQVNKLIDNFIRVINENI